MLLTGLEGGFQTRQAIGAVQDGQKDHPAGRGLLGRLALEGEVPRLRHSVSKSVFVSPAAWSPGWGHSSIGKKSYAKGQRGEWRKTPQPPPFKNPAISRVYGVGRGMAEI